MAIMNKYGITPFMNQNKMQIQPVNYPKMYNSTQQDQPVPMPKPVDFLGGPQRMPPEIMPAIQPQPKPVGFLGGPQRMPPEMAPPMLPPEMPPTFDNSGFGFNNNGFPDNQYRRRILQQYLGGGPGIQLY